MSAPATYRMLDHYKGDTFDGVRFTLEQQSDNSPVDLTNAQIKIQFRKNKITGQLTKEITVGDGITIEDAVNGVFKIDPFLIDWDEKTYYYDVQITFPYGLIKTYVKGTLRILQDTTY